MSEVKTREEWLKTLPSPIKEKALKNLNKDFKDMRAHTLSEAIMYAFSWSDSIEGYDYWDKIQSQSGIMPAEKIIQPITNYSDV